MFVYRKRSKSGLFLFPPSRVVANQFGPPPAPLTRDHTRSFWAAGVQIGAVSIDEVLNELWIKSTGRGQELQSAATVAHSTGTTGYLFWADLGREDGQNLSKQKLDSYGLRSILPK